MSNKANFKRTGIIQWSNQKACVISFFLSIPLIQIEATTNSLYSSLDMGKKVFISFKVRVRSKMKYSLWKHWDSWLISPYTRSYCLNNSVSGRSTQYLFFQYVLLDKFIQTNSNYPTYKGKNGQNKPQRSADSWTRRTQTEEI